MSIKLTQIIFTIIIVWSFFFAPSLKAQDTPDRFELMCPSGYVPLVGPSSSTFNSVTGKFRRQTCIDTSGNILTIGANTHSGAETFGLINNTCYIDGVKWTSIQNAITSGTCTEINDRGIFSTSLGTLTVNRAVKILLGGSQSYVTTGITMSACGAIIEGIGDGTWVQYTPITGAGLTITYNGCNTVNGGLRMLRFFGPGNGTSTTGIVENNTLGASTFSLFKDGTVDGFGTQYQCQRGCGFTTFDNWRIFANNGVGFLYSNTVDNEKFTMTNSGVFGSFTNTSWSTCFQITGTSVLNLEHFGSSIDYCGMNVNNANARVHFSHTYFENTTTVSGPTAVLTLTNGLVSFGDGTDIFMSGATCQNWASISGGTLQLAPGSRFNCNGASGGAVVAATAGNFDYSTNPVMVGFANLYSVSGSGNINASRSAQNGFAGNYMTLGGSAADIAFRFGNLAAGAKNWDLVNGGTGEILGNPAGDLFWYDGTATWLEYGSGIGGVKPRTLTFATLGTPGNGVFVYCSDCTIANPCAGAGTGAFAKRLNGVWVCN